MLRIPQSSSITRTSPSDYFLSYSGHSWVGGLTPQQRCSRCILQPQQSGQMPIEEWFNYFIARLLWTLHLFFFLKKKLIMITDVNISSLKKRLWNSRLNHFFLFLNLKFKRTHMYRWTIYAIKSWRQKFYTKFSSPVGWGYRIHLLHLSSGVSPTPKVCPRYDAKQSDCEAPVMLNLWRM